MQTATVKWKGGEEFLATMPSGNFVPFDASTAHKGGPGPMEMLLGALGACTSVALILILEKKRQKITSLEVNVSGERASEPPGLDQNRNCVSGVRKTRWEGRSRRDRAEPK